MSEKIELPRSSGGYHEEEDRMEARFKRLLSVCSEEDRKTLEFMRSMPSVAWEQEVEGPDFYEANGTLPDAGLGKKDWEIKKFEKKYGIENPAFGIDREDK